MPTTYTDVHTLTLYPSHPSTNYRLPKERKISRDILLDVAPDRESLLSSDKTIAELRHILKIRLKPDDENHWLYRKQKRANASLKENNTRISTLIPRLPPQNEPKDDIRVLRKVLSASADLNAPFNYQSNDDRSFFPGPFLDSWCSVSLSTDEKLISPRPLGPTHLIIAHSMSAPLDGGGRKPLRRRKSLPLSNVVEVPINDLIFVLNVPNLAPTTPILPPRLHKELARVLMYVPHTETFPELVVYLHTQNQAELFRKLVPEWIRDLMHPFPHPDPVASPQGPAAETKSPTKSPLNFLGFFISSAPQLSSSRGENSTAPRGDVRSRNGYRRTVSSVAQDITQAAQALPQDESDNMPDWHNPLLGTVAQLAALGDNLVYIGYYAEDLWYELGVYVEVLTKAVGDYGKIVGGDRKE